MDVTTNVEIDAMAKSANELVAEANAAIDKVEVAGAKALLNREDVVFVDVREGSEVAKGKIPGAVHVPRGVLEFIADPTSPLHNEALSSGKHLLVYCASGGRSALAGKTLKDMGAKQVTNMLGGINAWREAGGDIES
ncbi:MAG: rhodanese-like domain-containing protein [Geminicoccales bacterium]